MKKISSSEIGFYGKPIDRLTREELIEALIEVATAIKECTSDNKACEKIIFVKKDTKR